MTDEQMTPDDVAKMRSLINIGIPPQTIATTLGYPLETISVKCSELYGDEYILKIERLRMLYAALAKPIQEGNTGAVKTAAYILEQMSPTKLMAEQAGFHSDTRLLNALGMQGKG
jgi:hypothetical protein